MAGVGQLLHKITRGCGCRIVSKLFPIALYYSLKYSLLLNKICSIVFNVKISLCLKSRMALANKNYHRSIYRTEVFRGIFPDDIIYLRWKSDRSWINWMSHVSPQVCESVLFLGKILSPYPKNTVFTLFNFEIERDRISLKSYLQSNMASVKIYCLGICPLMLSGTVSPSACPGRPPGDRLPLSVLRALHNK